MAYDDYRQTPTERQDPMALGGKGPKQYYGESSSIWGNMGTLGRASSLNPMTWGAGVVKGVTGSVAGAVASEKAKQARMRAVAQWRIAQGQKYSDLLGQAGADVRGDLDPEVQKALQAGGAMGDMGAVKNSMQQFQQRYQQYMLGRQQAGQARQVDAQMADPSRISQRNQRMRAERTQGMGDIAEQYRIGQRNNAFDQARRGMQGGSADVEQQGKLGRGRDVAAQGLQSGLDAKAQQYRLGDQQQRSQLMGLIYGDDPNTAAALSRTMEGLNSQGAMAQENQAISAQRSQQQSATSTGYSQALGGALSAASRPLGYYIEHNGGGM